jgi:hypothetical protein
MDLKIQLNQPVDLLLLRGARPQCSDILLEPGVQLEGIP